MSSITTMKGRPDRHARRHEEAEEVGAVLDEAVDHDRADHEHGQREGDDDVAGHGEEAGIMPSRFAVSTNMKSEKTRGKNFILACGIDQRVRDEVVQHLGHRLGAARNDGALARRQQRPPTITAAAPIMNRDEFVKLMTGMMGLIWNCSIGLP